MIYVRLIEALWPVTYLAGLIVTIRYFRKHGRPVFAMLLVYFALGLYSSTLARHVNRLIRLKYTPEITQEQIEKYEAYQKETEELHIKHFGTAPGSVATVVKRVTVPLGQILLVATLLLLGKRIERKTPNRVAGTDP